MKKSNKTKLFSKTYLLYDFAKITAAIPGLIGFRPKIIFENDEARKAIRGAAILIGNHTGYLDPVYMQFAIWYRRHHFICAKEFFEGKKKFFFKNFLCIPIDRDNFGIDSFREIISHLKQGELVSMFPEGKITDGLKSFKSGMILMALQSGAPIIPMYIKRQTKWKERLTMAIGEPIFVSEHQGTKFNISGIEAATEELQIREVKLQKICERGRK